MPIYEYQCEACGEEFEELVGAAADSPACPNCGSDKTGKLMSCCRHRGAAPTGAYGASSSSGGGCAGCSGGSCATCH